MTNTPVPPIAASGPVLTSPSVRIRTSSLPRRSLARRCRGDRAGLGERQRAARGCPPAAPGRSVRASSRVTAAADAGRREQRRRRRRTAPSRRPSRLPPRWSGFGAAKLTQQPAAHRSGRAGPADHGARRRRGAGRSRSATTSASAATKRGSVPGVPTRAKNRPCSRRGLGRLVVQIPDHLDVVGDESDRHDDHARAGRRRRDRR